MSIAELVFEKTKTLKPEEQQKVLAFVEGLNAPTGPRKDTRGALAHLGISLSLEDFLEARREAWGNFPRDFPETSLR